MRGPEKQNADRLAMYREMQRAVPGLDGMYRLLNALIASHEKEAPRVLIVGAGGGRELEELLDGHFAGQITAIDPSAENLDLARAVVRKSRSSPEVRFVVGTVGDIPEGETFDVATSMLVMHHLKDDGAKLAYLKGLRERLAPGGYLIHADVSFDQLEDFRRLVPLYLAHAKIFGGSPEATCLERDAISDLSVVSGARTEDLFAEAGLTAPFEVFRSLWYRCWISTWQS
ncbi:class I SAM-dependent methyltransferase [Sulfitobacter sp. D35]|uniref:class I SAM-dependent methyltransferase n=1 Tax=Sulfitobacter sp. D35 TaxID=3083252 RepID=UPI00296F4808|nr:class I SAM-dependent methyltransferase [Sulfitobacter sp. D35]MDW4500194.1 class I SAM-dependent methyltransferase [Sulfitobacter sp. D35]